MMPFTHKTLFFYLGEKSLEKPLSGAATYIKSQPIAELRLQGIRLAPFKVDIDALKGREEVGVIPASCMKLSQASTQCDKNFGSIKSSMNGMGRGAKLDPILDVKEKHDARQQLEWHVSEESHDACLYILLVSIKN
jgi:hypothetical protein